MFPGWLTIFKDFLGLSLDIVIQQCSQNVLASQEKVRVSNCYMRSGYNEIWKWIWVLQFVSYIKLYWIQWIFIFIHSMILSLVCLLLCYHYVISTYFWLPQFPQAWASKGLSRPSSVIGISNRRQLLQSSKLWILIAPVTSQRTQ